MKRHALWLLLLLAVPAIALQPLPPRQSRQNLVTLGLVFQDGSPATVTVRDGGMATYENLRFRVKLGIVPRVIDAAAGDVDLDVVSIEGEPGAQRPTSRLETLRGKVGFSSVTSAGRALPLEVSVVRLEAEPLASPANMLSSPSSSTVFAPVEEEMRSVGGCCVSCGSELICGCAVASDCGSCCGCSFC